WGPAPSRPGSHLRGRLRIDGLDLVEDAQRERLPFADGHAVAIAALHAAVFVDEALFSGVAVESGPDIFGAHLLHIAERLREAFLRGVDKVAEVGIDRGVLVAAAIHRAVAA